MRDLTNLTHLMLSFRGPAGNFSKVRMSPFFPPDAHFPGVKSVKCVKAVKSVQNARSGPPAGKMRDLTNLTHLMLSFRGPAENFPKSGDRFFPPDAHFPGVKSVKSIKPVQNARSGLPAGKMRDLTNLTHLMLSFRGLAENFLKSGDRCFPPDTHFPGVKSVKCVKSVKSVQNARSGPPAGKMRDLTNLTHLMLSFRGPAENFPKSGDRFFSAGRPLSGRQVRQVRQVRQIRSKCTLRASCWKNARLDQLDALDALFSGSCRKFSEVRRSLFFRRTPTSRASSPSSSSSLSLL